MTFLLKVIDKGELQVPLANVIVAVELLNTIPLRLNDCRKFHFVNL